MRSGRWRHAVYRDGSKRNRGEGARKEGLMCIDSEYQDGTGRRSRRSRRSEASACTQNICLHMKIRSVFEGLAALRSIVCIKQTNSIETIEDFS